jgi:hypothetical protein
LLELERDQVADVGIVVGDQHHGHGCPLPGSVDIRTISG